MERSIIFVQSYSSNEVFARNFQVVGVKCLEGLDLWSEIVE